MILGLLLAATSVPAAATARPEEPAAEEPAALLEETEQLSGPEEDRMPLTVEELWEVANAAYVEGDYAAAEAAYRTILEQGLVSMKLWYNLANACFKQERLGEAILCYNRALRLAPGNDDVRYNLEVAEARTKDTIERLPEFFVKGWIRSLRRTMGCTAWSLVSLAALAVLLAGVLLFLLAQRLTLRKAGFYGTLAALLIFVVTTLFAVAERREMAANDEAVIMVSSTAVKSSPDRSSTDLFVLHEGTKVRIDEQIDDWCEIRIADGKKGWIERRKIEII